MLPTSAGIEPATSWSPDGRRIQLSHRGRQALPVFKMKNKTSFDSRVYIKGRVGLNVSVSQIYSEVCQIHWASVVSKRSVFRWHKYFKGGKTDEPRPGQPRKAATKAYVAAVADMVKQNARFTVKEIAGSAGVSSGTVHMILTRELKLRKVCAQWIPHLLTKDQKTNPCKNGEKSFGKVQKF